MNYRKSIEGSEITDNEPSATAPTDLLTLVSGTVDDYGDIAVSDSRTAITYADLDTNAKRIATLLTESRVRPGSTVAVSVGRHPELLPIILGILKAGCAYVPIDPLLPLKRREYMIARSAAVALFTGSGTGEDYAADTVAVLDHRQALGMHLLKQDTDVRPDDLACILFTSGSSGEPKPVMLTHNNLASFITNSRLPTIRPDDTIAHISSISFDAFQYEMWSAMKSGAQIVVMETLSELLNTDIARELRARNVSVMLVPSMAFNHIMRSDASTFSNLRILCIGGDVVSPRECGNLFAGSFGGELYNLYGPTEATVACTCHRVEISDSELDEVPIGFPLSGVTLRILDDELNECTTDAIGQIYIGGDTLSPGYFRDESRTAEHFIRDPYESGGLLYATGDRGSVDKRGIVHFLGRMDGQVKIRGYRVEPRETETVISQVPGVDRCATIAVGEGADKQLVAFVVGPSSLSMGEIRREVESRLPDYMVPAMFARLSEIPITPHGKRDDHALRSSAAEQIARRSKQVPPVNALEVEILRIWKELLPVEHIGVTDDFYDLGGNSLIAFRVQRRVNKELDTKIEQRDVLTSRTVRELATIAANG
ncbi:amino acid adenylation domain-containing protein [Nocardia tenerifensis]|uniref:Amino acid adenylation domain-containing protein n=1 Tax=Nocardia tenerifensis TaxID=228006 RepID=A0A318JN19_9NOCA|nr:non-ribosomal peptide synthetase [Nocardia tenerifensis]PXX56281.1 amino acid adenylation domain-containing protein [Nocardia tenerifensis]